MDGGILKGCRFVTNGALCRKAALAGVSECKYAPENRTRCPDYAVESTAPVVVL